MSNLSADITIMSIEASPYGCKITAHDKKVYNVSKTTKDGQISTAWNQMVDMGLKATDPLTGTPGSSVNIWYAESPNKHGGISRYIRSFKETDARPETTLQATQTPQRQESPRSGQNLASSAKLERNYEREAYEKCCAIWAAAHLPNSGTEGVQNTLNKGLYWELFQAIKADGEKRFSPLGNIKVNSPEVQQLIDDEPPLEEPPF